MIIMSGNKVYGGKNSHFNIGSNEVEGFELGRHAGDDVWLKGDIVGHKEEFLFNARLYSPNTLNLATIIDNFPKATPPKGWHIRPRVGEIGFNLVSDSDGEILFGYRVVKNTCIVTVNLYNKIGDIVAGCKAGQFEIYKSIDVCFGPGGIVFRKVQDAA